MRHFASAIAVALSLAGAALAQDVDQAEKMRQVVAGINEVTDTVRATVEGHEAWKADLQERRVAIAEAPERVDTMIEDLKTLMAGFDEGADSTRLLTEVTTEARDLVADITALDDPSMAEALVQAEAALARAERMDESRQVMLNRARALIFELEDSKPKLQLLARLGNVTLFLDSYEEGLTSAVGILDVVETDILVPAREFIEASGVN